MTARHATVAESEHRQTQCQRLRGLFSDTARWYTNVELQRLMRGQRFGARLLELRRGDDGGPPLDIQRTRQNGKGSIWAYRCVGVLEKASRRQSSPVARLRRELARALARIAELEGARQ